MPAVASLPGRKQAENLHRPLANLQGMAAALVHQHLLDGNVEDLRSQIGRKSRSVAEPSGRVEKRIGASTIGPSVQVGPKLLEQRHTCIVWRRAPRAPGLLHCQIQVADGLALDAGGVEDDCVHPRERVLRARFLASPEHDQQTRKEQEMRTR